MNRLLVIIFVIKVFAWTTNFNRNIVPKFCSKVCLTMFRFSSLCFSSLFSTVHEQTVLSVQTVTLPHVICSVKKGFYPKTVRVLPQSHESPFLAPPFRICLAIAYRCEGKCQTYGSFGPGFTGEKTFSKEKWVRTLVRRKKCRCSFFCRK